MEKWQKVDKISGSLKIAPYEIWDAISFSCNGGGAVNGDCELSYKEMCELQCRDYNFAPVKMEHAFIYI